MTKYIFLLSFFLFSTSPAMAARGVSNSGSPQGQSDTITPVKTSPIQVSTVPTGKQNQQKTQNQGETKQLNVQTQQNEQLNGDFTRVSDQVHQLLDTVGAKGGIGQQVREIAQNQQKTQLEIKSDFDKLQSRGRLMKFFFGSDKKLTKSLEQKMEQNLLRVQQLEQLMLETNNSSEIEELQQTVDLLSDQNLSLENTLIRENRVRGIFGWLITLFNR